MRISDWSSDVCSSDLKQNIAFGQFDAVALDVAIAQAFVMVVHRNRQITLGRILPYDIAIEEGFDFLRCGQFVADRIASRFLALFDDGFQIGGASGRERVCQYVSIYGVGGPLKKN